MSDAEDRNRRLAEALRTNLRRRKAQARGADAAATTDSPSGKAPADPAPR